LTCRADLQVREKNAGRTMIGSLQVRSSSTRISPQSAQVSPQVRIKEKTCTCVY